MTGSSRPHTVLYVDDEPALCLLAERMLRKAGHQPTTCTDIATAIMLVQAAPASFDVVLCDVHMGAVTGFDLCAAALAVDPSLPVVLVTGHAFQDLSDRALAVGARYLMEKPVTTNLLWQEVLRVIDTYAR